MLEEKKDNYSSELTRTQLGRFYKRLLSTPSIFMYGIFAFSMSIPGSFNVPYNKPLKMTPTENITYFTEFRDPSEISIHSINDRLPNNSPENKTPIKHEDLVAKLEPQKFKPSKKTPLDEKLNSLAL